VPAVEWMLEGCVLASKDCESEYVSTDQVLTIDLLNDVDNPSDGEKTASLIAPAALLRGCQQLVE